MAIDLYATETLNAIVRNLDQPANFLLDTFYPLVQEATAPEIYFDVESTVRRITPFVHPTVAGKIVEKAGYTTKSFRPAYAKDKRQFWPDVAFRRQIGEQIGGAMAPGQREEAAVNFEMRDQLNMLTRREAVMGAEAMLTGKVTVSGERYPTVVVDYGRASALAVTLGTNAMWGDSGVVPINNIETWAGLVSTNGGGGADTVVMDPLAYGLFRSSLGAPVLDYIRGTTNTINLDPANPVNGQATYRGNWGPYSFYVYQETYLDEDGASQSMLPDYTVIVANRAAIMGTRAYGFILDPEADPARRYVAMRYFSKSWIEKDPAVRWLLLQSAPLPVQYRPNAVLTATVKTVS